MVKWWCPRTAISPWATIATTRSTAAIGDLCRVANIIGKPLIIYWSYETTTDRLASPTISIDHAVDLVQNFFRQDSLAADVYVDPWLPIAKPEAPARKEVSKPRQRHWIAEWTGTILIFLFGTTTVLQAFVVPTGSMEGTMLIGDHLFVDRLGILPKGPIGSFLLPYQDVKRGDIIVFKYPLDLRQNYVKRVIGVPGDRIRIVDKVVHLNGSRLTSRTRC